MEEQELYTGFNRKMIEPARALRKNMTRQERYLWYHYLRDHPVKFYRQRPINRFVVDFYCSQARLVIELDGSQHYTEDGAACDAERTNVLQCYGIEVLRFSNLDVDRNFEAVCAAIDRKIRERLEIEPAEG